MRTTPPPTRYNRVRRLQKKKVFRIVYPVFKPSPEFRAIRERFLNRHVEAFIPPIRNMRDLLHQVYKYGDIETLRDLDEEKNFYGYLHPKAEDIAAALNESGFEAFHAICNFWGYGGASAGRRLALSSPMIDDRKRLFEAFDRLGEVGHRCLGPPAKRECLSAIPRNCGNIFLALLKRLKIEEMIESTPLDVITKLPMFRCFLLNYPEKVMAMMDGLMAQPFYTAYWKKQCIEHIDGILSKTWGTKVLAFFKSLRAKLIAHCPCRGICHCDAVVEYQE